MIYSLLLSILFNPTIVELLVSTTFDLLQNIANIVIRISTTAEAMTIPAIAPPDNPLEFFLHLTLEYPLLFLAISI